MDRAHSNPTGGRRPFAAFAQFARRIVRTVATWSHRVLDLVPATWLGVVVGALAVLAVVDIGAESVDLILIAVGWTGIGLVITSASLVVLASLGLWLVVRRRGAGVPSALTVSIATETSFRCPRLRLLPLVQVDYHWEEPEAVEVQLARRGGSFLEHITAHERGKYARVCRRFTVRDVFGFAAIHFRVRWDAAMVIAPAGSKSDLGLIVRRGSDDGYSHPSGRPVGEMVEIGRYQPGTSAKHILWKMFARSRRLMVREQERAIAPKPAMVAYFIAAPGDEASASTARLCIEQGLLGEDFIFAADGATHPTTRAADALDQVIASRAFRAKGAEGLATLVRSVDRSRLDNLVVFAPPSEGAWIDRLLVAARSVPLPPLVILSVEAHPVHRRRGWLGRFFFRDAGPTGRPLAEAARVIDRLRQGGVELRLVHRGSAALIDNVDLAAWREAA